MRFDTLAKNYLDENLEDNEWLALIFISFKEMKPTMPVASIWHIIPISSFDLSRYKLASTRATILFYLFAYEKAPANVKIVMSYTVACRRSDNIRHL